MRAWLLDNNTGLDALHLVADAPIPEPGPDEVRIKVQFAALNPADRFLAENRYPAKPAYPHILGRDGSGTVDTVGSRVRSWKAGDRVAILRGDAGVEKPGTLAEYVCVPAEVVVPVPPKWSMEQAAAGPLVYLTAYQALTQWGSPNGWAVLITGASGGVGLASIHLATAMTLKVIGTSREESKRQQLLEHGCAHVVDSDGDLKSDIRKATHGRGVDLIIDNIAGPLFNKLLDVVADRGRISVVGMLGGLVPSFNPAKLLFRRTRIGGVLVSGYSAQEAQDAWREIVSLLGTIGRAPVIDSIFEMDRLQDAFDRLAAGPFGKILVRAG
jgi:NADPH2:quinone reductase